MLFGLVAVVIVVLVFDVVVRYFNVHLSYCC